MVTLRPRKPKKKEEKVPASVAAAAAATKTNKAKSKPQQAKAKTKTTTSAESSKKKYQSTTASTNKQAVAKTPPVARDDNEILQQFLAKTDASKHDDITTLDKLIRQHAPSLQPELQGKATLAYGGFDYQTKSKCQGRWARIGIMVNKTGLSIMVSGRKDNQYLLETYPNKQHFGKATLGKSCIRFQTLANLNLEHIQDLITVAATADISALAV